MGEFLLRAICSSTSPRGGEVGWRSHPGEGGGRFVLIRVLPPHPTPLPLGEREQKEGPF